MENIKLEMGQFTRGLKITMKYYNNNQWSSTARRPGTEQQ